MFRERQLEPLQLGGSGDIAVTQEGTFCKSLSSMTKLDFRLPCASHSWLHHMFRVGNANWALANATCTSSYLERSCASGVLHILAAVAPSGHMPT